MPANEIRKFVFKLALFAPILFLVMAANYVLDPARLFSGKAVKEVHVELRERLKVELKEEPIDEYVLGIADYLLNGLNVAGAANYDGRLLQKYCIIGSKQQKDVIVLGSSRSWDVNSKIFPKKIFFNHGVSAATMEDLFAIFNIYEEREEIPPVIIVGVDPWVFQRHNKIRWKSIGKDYEAMAKKLEEFSKTVKAHRNKSPFLNKFDFIFFWEGIFFEKYFQLVSFSYFQSSLEEFVKLARERRIYEIIGNRSASGVHGNSDAPVQTRLNVGSGSQSRYSPTQEIEGQQDIILTDGSLNFPRSAKTRPAQEILQEIKAVISQGSESNMGSSYEKMDPALKRQFEDFVEYLRDRKIRVVFFLPPFHPFFYDYMLKSQKFDGVMEVENYIRGFAREEGIDVVGSYDPRKCSLTQDDFMDYFHAKRDRVERIFGSTQ